MSGDPRPTDPVPIGTPTVVGPGGLVRALVWITFPLLGAAAAALLKVALSWAAWAEIPIPGLARLLTRFPEPQATFGVLAIGFVLGLIVAGMAERDYVTISVDHNEVTLRHGQTAHTFARTSIGAVFVDAKEVVLLGRGTEELVRQRGDLPNVRRIEEAFVAHGYPWRTGGDPYGGEYRRWVDDAPELPAAAHAVLRARDRALRAGDQADVTDLRTELGRLGLVVRDQNKRQYWRRTQRARR
jgi:hypothetical protein